MRIFADTNVLFDIFAQRDPFRESSCKLMIMQMFGDAEIWAAPQSYLDIFYVLGKGDARRSVQEALSNSLSHINVATVSHSDVQEAFTAGWDDAEDALIALCCKNVAADYFLTRDEKQDGFKHMGVPSMTPEEFFELMQEEYGVLYSEIEW